LINNRQGGRRRGRGGQRGQNLGGNRQDNRQRGNAAQLLEKYKNMARDAQLAGDRVQSEYFLQFAEHYFRVLDENRSRFDEPRNQRGDDSSDDNENDNQEESASASDQDRGDGDNRRSRSSGRGRPQHNGAETNATTEEDHERIAVTALPPAIGREPDSEDEPAAKPKRRTRKPRNDGDGADIAPAA
jgi:hypothetical protein